MDRSPPGSSVHGIFQARVLEWVVISFSNAWKCKVKVKPLSRVGLFPTPWTAAYQAPLSMGFSRQEYWSGVPSPSPILSLLYIYYSFYKSREKAMAPHSSTLAWKIPWIEDPGRLQSMGSLRVGYGWATSLSLFTFMHWRRKWQPSPVFLPRESQGWGSLVGCRLWGRTESDTTEVT